MQSLKQTCCLLLMAFMASLVLLSEGFTRHPTKVRTGTATFLKSSTSYFIGTSCNGLAPISIRNLSQRELISMHESRSSEDPAEGADDIVACKITVTGDVNGGYYRACVLNEAGKFRRLLGRMSDPSDTNQAEIYVEGRRKLVEGFVRWCHRSDKKVGLNQKVNVINVSYDEEPTGLYDAFYCRIK